MKLVAQQPNYFPWAGYYEQIAAADLFVFLDDVQWIKQGRQHRTRIPYPKNEVREEKNWLTIPVQSEGHREKPLKEMLIDTTRPWAEKHWRQIEAIYREAPYFRSQLEPLLRPFFEKVRNEKFLIDVCQESLWVFWDALELTTELQWSSDVQPKGEKSERLISLCQHFHADVYYSALGATRYIDLAEFRNAGIRVEWQHFRSLLPSDPLRSADFSILDWVALASWEEIRKAIRPRVNWNSIGSNASHALVGSLLPATDALAQSDPARPDLEPPQ